MHIPCKLLGGEANKRQCMHTCWHRGVVKCGTRDIEKNIFYENPDFAKK